MNRRRHLALAAASLGLPALTLLQACAPQETVPDLPYTRLDGQTARITGHQGRVLLVNFWATSCSSCIQEMPELMATHTKYGARGYDTLAVAMSYDPPEYVANFVQSRKLPFTIALDGNGALAKGFGEIRLTPTSILVDKSGRIVKRYVGPPDFAALHQEIEKLLAA